MFDLCSPKAIVGSFAFGLIFTGLAFFILGKMLTWIVETFKMIGGR